MVVGAGGMLGTALQRMAPHHGLTVRPYTEAQLDVTDHAAIRSAVGSFARHAIHAGIGGAVINAAAFTNVEAAEDDPDRAHLVNATAAGWLASATHDEGLAFAHVSTDFVFDGEKIGPYTEDDTPNPLSVYGSSKLAGERAVAAAYPQALIVRTAWVFGPPGPNFPLKILAAARRALEAANAAGAASAAQPPTPALRVVTDEVGPPTFTVDLAGGLLDLLAAGTSGLVNLTNGGSCSRYELAVATLLVGGYRVPADLEVEPVTSDAFTTKARRPRNSVLDCSRAAALGIALPEWGDGLDRFVAELIQAEATSPERTLPTQKAPPPNSP